MTGTSQLPSLASLNFSGPSSASSLQYIGNRELYPHLCSKRRQNTIQLLVTPHTRFRELNFRLQYRLIAPQVLTKLHGRFLFPLSGLSSQSVGGDSHSADLVGAYWRNMKMRNKRPTLSNHKKCLQVVVGVSEFVYMRDLVSLIRDIPIFGDILSLFHLQLRSRLYF